MKLFCTLFLFVFIAGCKNDNTTAAKKITNITQKIVAKINNYDFAKQSIDSSFLALIPDKTILAFYATSNNETVWISEKNRKELIENLKNSYQEGLSPEDYAIQKLTDFEKNNTTLTKTQIIEYDLLLTQQFYRYIAALTNGKLNPKKLYTNWDLKPNAIDIEKMLITALKDNTVNDVIAKSKPHHIVYNRLKEALVSIDTFPNEDFQNITFPKKKKLVQCDSNAVMLPIKKRLMYWKDMKKTDSLTTIYDEATFDAVKKFQKRHGLQDDGVIGLGTLAALNVSKEKRKQQIIANLERWRWFPRNMGENYLIINIPDYILHVIKEKDTVRTHKVIVGTTKRETPVLSSKLSSIVYNPTWTVPPTILKEDLIPATSKSTNYLASKNITVYDKSNKVVPLTNWKAEDARNYTYVQNPGNYNALGRVKIIFKNAFQVYLHDTNSRNLFNQTNRSISSGCIRVENPMELTAYLLSDTIHWNQDKINKIITTKNTRNVNIEKDFQIHLLYWTAWMDDNQLEFRDDIYQLDTDLYKKLKQ